MSWGGADRQGGVATNIYTIQTIPLEIDVDLDITAQYLKSINPVATTNLRCNIDLTDLARLTANRGLGRISRLQRLDFMLGCDPAFRAQCTLE
jgi:hypothetical protein